MKFLCNELGWLYDCFVDNHSQKMYISVNRVINNKTGFPMDVEMIWEVILLNG